MNLAMVTEGMAAGAAAAAAAAGKNQKDKVDALVAEAGAAPAAPAVGAEKKRKERVDVGGEEGAKEAAMAAAEVMLPAVRREGNKLRLGELSAEQKFVAVFSAKRFNLLQLAEALQAKGVVLSMSTLSRHLAKWRGEVAVYEGEELVVAAEKLAARKKAEALREGSLEAVRQQMFEGVLACNTRAERTQFYEMLVGEEERIRKLALEERRVAAQERNLELKAEQLRVEGARGGAALIVELVRLMGDQALEEKAKLAAMRERLERWKGGAIEVQNAEGRLQIGDAVAAERPQGR